MLSGPNAAGSRSLTPRAQRYDDTHAHVVHQKQRLSSFRRNFTACLHMLLRSNEKVLVILRASRGSR